MTHQDVRETVEMCGWYDPQLLGKCRRARHGSLKCHAMRGDCPLYEASLYPLPRRERLIDQALVGKPFDTIRTKNPLDVNELLSDDEPTQAELEEDTQREAHEEVERGD